MKHKLKKQGFHLAKGIGLCVKGPEGHVLFQNKACQKLCGNRKNKICHDGCMEFYPLEDSTKTSIGSQELKCKNIHGFPCDVVFANDGTYLITLLVFLEKKLERDLKFFKKFNLTPRELEVIQLTLKGKTNQQIADLLFISRSTLKTHLNNIYKKLPDPQVVIDRRSRA